MGAHIGLITFDPSVVAKLKLKHNITPSDVRAALEWPAQARSAWEQHPDHERRLVALGHVADRPVIASLMPLPAWDEDADTWLCLTARWA